MDKLSAQAVFFVKDAERSLVFYTKTLGFNLDWNYQEQGRAFVFRVSLFGFELILNQIDEHTQSRPGHGRVFIGLDETQSAAVRQHWIERGIQPTVDYWGAPTLIIRDIDANELFFWLPETERDALPQP